jgi:hypothetical protein
MGEKRNSYRILVGKPEGERPLGRPRRRWMDTRKETMACQTTQAREKGVPEAVRIRPI